MIDKNEIFGIAKKQKVPISTIEKDYVLSWFLAAIQHQKELFNNWIFKGGTCLRKCYFENYRFSEDLDFTLHDSSHINERFLKSTFMHIANWIYEEVGIKIPSDGIKIEIFPNKQRKEISQISIKYCGPLKPKIKSNWPKIKLDLTANEKLVTFPIKQEIFHLYSDKPLSGIYIKTYSIEEIFSEKLRALFERCRPRDLYDIINLFQKKDLLKLSKDNCKKILIKKCSFKSLDIPNYKLMEKHIQKKVLISQWSNMLQHQIAELSSWEFYWKILPEVFQWMDLSE